MENKKLSSYQKMKMKYEQTILQLNDDIRTLIKNNDSCEVLSIRMKYQLTYSCEDATFSGNIPENYNLSTGILKK